MPLRLTLVWAATGEQHRREAERSARSVQGWRPEVGTELWTDAAPEPAFPADLVDRMRTIEAPSFSSFDKIQVLRRVRGEAILFLDSDTRLLRPCPEIATLLETCEFAGVHAPCRVTSIRNYAAAAVPSCFPELNSGVLAFRPTPAVTALLERWAELYREARGRLGPGILDQPALRQALWENAAALRLAVLPAEYNLRPLFPMMVGGNGEPVILHGRGEPLERALAALAPQATATPRIFEFTADVPAEPPTEPPAAVPAPSPVP